MKQKTKKAAQKRIKRTGTGKMMVQKAARNHLRSSKNKRQLKVNRLGQSVPAGHIKQMTRALGRAA